MAVNLKAEDVTVQLRLDHPPSVRMIASARRFVQELCEPLLGADAGSRVAMVVHELLENLAKYAEGGPMRLEVDVAPRQDHYHVRITAANRASSDRLEALEEILEEISRSQDPRATHLSHMNRSVARSESSGLGLTRIRAEGEMEIAYSLTGDEFIVHAEALLPKWSH